MVLCGVVWCCYGVVWYSVMLNRNENRIEERRGGAKKREEERREEERRYVVGEEECSQ